MKRQNNITLITFILGKRRKFCLITLFEITICTSFILYKYFISRCYLSFCFPCFRLKTGVMCSPKILIIFLIKGNFFFLFFVIYFLFQLHQEHRFVQSTSSISETDSKFIIPKLNKLGQNIHQQSLSQQPLHQIRTKKIRTQKMTVYI